MGSQLLAALPADRTGAPRRNDAAARLSCAAKRSAIIQPPMSFFETDDGCSIFYRLYGKSGTNAVIVFVNGTAQSTKNWLPFATRLKKHLRVVLFDTRGQGESGRGTAPLTLDTLVADLWALLDHLGVKTAGLAGLSHGSRVALAAARQTPNRVERLLLCSIGLNGNPRISAFVRSWQHVLKTGGMEALAWSMVPVVFGERFLSEHRVVLPSVVAAMVQRNDPKRLAELLTAQSADPPVDWYADALNVPALVVAGTEDLLVTADGPEALAAALNGGVKRLSGVGHSIPAEAPDQFLELLHDFFGQQEWEPDP